MRRLATACLLVLVGSSHAPAAPQDPATPAAGASGPPPVVSRLVDARAWRQRLGLSPAYDGVNATALKIAVLDYGFDGAGVGRPYLPASTEIVEHYDPAFVSRYADLGDPAYRKPFEPGNRHGRAMAQIVWAITGNDPRGPTFYLLNASGPTMLRRAVRYAIAQKVDIILFSGSFEGGGDGDGRGPINRIVAEALAAGIVWINAAGNHGGRVANAPVRVLPEGYLRLGGGTDIAALRFRNRIDENTVTVTLTWNDYRDQEDAGTLKDLDLYVEDWAGRRIGASELVQVGSDRAAGPGESRNPRERVVLTDLPASPDVPSDPDCAYRIRVRARRGAFTARDRIRVLVTAARESYIRPGGFEPVEALEFLDASREEEIYPPADHPLVLAVGAAEPSSSVGPTTDRRVKPDVILKDVRAYFTDGTATTGSSNAAALFAGVVAVLKAAEPGLQTRHLLDLARRGGSADRATTPTTTPTTTRPTRPAPRSSGVRIITRTGGTSTAAPPPTGRTALPEPLERRIWRTPTRAELAALVRRGR